MDSGTQTGPPHPESSEDGRGTAGQFIDKVVDIPVIRQRQMSVGVSGDCAESQGEEEQEEQEVSGSLVQG